MAGTTDNQLASADGQQASHRVKSHMQRKRQRTDDAEGDDHATSARVRHPGRQHQHHADAAAQTIPPAGLAHLTAGQPNSATNSAQTPSAAPEAAEQSNGSPAGEPAPVSPFAGPTTAAAQTQAAAPNGHAPVAVVLPSSLPVAASTSSQQGDCLAPDGSFVGRAAAAGLPPNILRQTRAALGLWEQLHETASTPSTVLPPINRHAVRTVSVGTDNSAA